MRVSRALTANADKVLEFAQPLFHKGVISALCIIFEEQKSVELCTEAAWLFSNLLYTDKVDESTVTLKMIQNVTELLHK